MKQIVSNTTVTFSDRKLVIMNNNNHLANLCNFLDDAVDFEHNLYEENFKYDERLRDDPALQYNEDDSREVFAEVIFNILREADIDTCLANRITDTLSAAFYHVNDTHYNEAAALQRLLVALDIAAKEQNHRFENGDYTDSMFKITIGSTSTEFLLGGPQQNALCKFVECIADENGYEVDFDNSTVSK